MKKPGCLEGSGYGSKGVSGLRFRKFRGFGVLGVSVVWVQWIEFRRFSVLMLSVWPGFLEEHPRDSVAQMFFC